MITPPSASRDREPSGSEAATQPARIAPEPRRRAGAADRGRALSPTVAGVVGPGRRADGLAVAEAVGAELARRGAVVVCGGLGGAMEAACRGAKEAGGMTRRAAAGH